MTTQDKIDNAMLAAVVESRAWGDTPLGLGDSVHDLDIGTGGPEDPRDEDEAAFDRACDRAPEPYEQGMGLDD